jgi:hypothetical protein
MSLYIDNTVDPLAALPNGRELPTSPRHFVKIQLSAMIDAKIARDWIWKNLNSRFYIRQSQCASFEDPSEASMFALIKDQFAINDNF